MALAAFPHIAKQVSLSDNTTYASSWDRRHMIVRLRNTGYGVIVPDLLGYGDTDKPVELNSYAMTKMTQHIVEILDIEDVGKCIGGSAMLSMLAIYHPDRLLGVVTVTPTKSELWKTDLCPPGAARAWLKAGKTTSLPPYITVPEYLIRQNIFSDGGYRAPLNWYKVSMRGVNAADDALISEENKYLTLPNLFIQSTKDFAWGSETQVQKIKRWARNPRIENLECGHWPQLEKPDELFTLIGRLRFGHQRPAQAVLAHIVGIDRATFIMSRLPIAFSDRTAAIFYVE
ncbi:hypothetical protein CIHG_05500 [Coccidioides immitis H538.4]|uniref:AB hydrolase-1 domain-containing protein n=2 Tax=Coccidioides immitis TaxID=5501 RepID=A0A0J8UJT5_COCIT|nr:hypothetical protein CIRG_05737 [Coccidioides immitis RMSCC 2394]KMU87733.1 hypothetical protein CIHG_05500 [Coccidioides immitis H538.4]